MRSRVLIRRHLITCGPSVSSSVKWELQVSSYRVVIDDETGWKDFPRGPGVQNSPACARDADSTLNLGSFHMPQGMWTKPVCHKLPHPHTLRLCCTTREATATRSPSIARKSSPPLAPTRESPRAVTKTQRSQK